MSKHFWLLTFLLLSSALSADADDRVYGPVNVASTTISGDQVRGPIKVQIVGVNIIQRNVQVGINVTYPAGPDLTLPFIPPIPKSGAAPTTTAPSQLLVAPHAPPTVASIFDGLIESLKSYEKERYRLQGSIQTAIDTVNSASMQVGAFVGSSNAALAADPAGKGLLSQIRPMITGPIQAALAASWPNSDVAALEGNLAMLKDSLATLSSNGDWSTWIANPGNKTAYDAAVTRTNDLIGLAAALESSSNKSASTMSDSQSKLQQWAAILGNIADAAKSGKDPFSQTIDVTCSFGFSNNKNSQVEMISTDRLAAPGTAPTKQEIVTVICSSPLSISAGFSFSTVHEQQVSFIQSLNSSNQVVSVFGYKGLSNFKPLPLLMLNTRLHEWKDDWAVHASTGAVVDIKTGAAGSTDVEYIAGLSVSYKRSFFITPGFHAGRVQKLAGGFSIGQVVPQGISIPPVESHWTPGFILAFSYRLK
jgi:hypothetical protein